MGYFDSSRPHAGHPAAPGGTRRPGRFVPGSDGALAGRRFAGYVDEPHTGGQYVRSFKAASQEARAILARAAGDGGLREAV